MRRRDADRTSALHAVRTDRLLLRAGNPHQVSFPALSSVFLDLISKRHGVKVRKWEGSQNEGSSAMFFFKTPTPPSSSYVNNVRLP